jgi:hypothetical protein
MALGKSVKLIWSDISDVSFIDYSRRDCARCDQFAEPLGGEWIYFVVERSGLRHPASSLSCILSAIGF